jgi:hypothetical protein
VYFHEPPLSVLIPSESISPDVATASLRALKDYFKHGKHHEPAQNSQPEHDESRRSSEEWHHSQRSSASRRDQPRRDRTERLRNSQPDTRDTRARAGPPKKHEFPGEMIRNTHHLTPSLAAPYCPRERERNYNREQERREPGTDEVPQPLSHPVESS